MIGPYTPPRDLSGQLIAKLPTVEIQRRRNILRHSDDHPITVQYTHAYDAALKERAGLTRARISQLAPRSGWEQ